jgi:hypothetical protein
VLDRDARTLPAWLAPASIVLVTALCRLPSFLRPMSDTDEAIYASIAALMNRGGRLYLDGGVDMKCPGIFWTYAAVFRVAGPYAMGAVHLLTLLVVLATATVLGLIAYRVDRGKTGGKTGRKAGLFAALFYGVFSSVFYPQMLAANTEVFMMLPLCAAMLLLLARPPSEATPGALFASAFLVAIACTWKQVAIVNGALLLYVAMRSPRRAHALVAGFAGALLGFALPLAVLWQTSSIPDMWHWAFERVAARYGPAAWSPMRYLSGLATSGVMFLVSTLPLCAAVFARLRSTRRSTEREGFIVAWCALSCIAVAAGGHFFGHYYLQLIGPLCVLAALEWSARDSRVRVTMVALTCASGLAFFVIAIRYDPIELGFRRGPAIYEQVGAYVRAHTQADDRIFVWSDAGPIYLAADRVPSTRFVGFLRGLDRAEHASPHEGWDCGPEVWPLFEADFAAHPPELIVDTSPADLDFFRSYPITLFPNIARHLERDYQRETTVAGVDIYRKRRSR